MNTLVLWTLHPVKMLTVINQFLLLQKGVFSGRYLLLFSVSLFILLYFICSPGTAQTNLSHDQDLT